MQEFAKKTVKYIYKLKNRQTFRKGGTQSRGSKANSYDCQVAIKSSVYNSL